MSLMVAAKARGRTLAHHQRTPLHRRAGWPIPEDEDFAPSFGAKVQKLVTRTAQKAGEVEIPRLERGGRLAPIPHIITRSVDT